MTSTQEKLLLVHKILKNSTVFRLLQICKYGRDVMRMHLKFRTVHLILPCCFIIFRNAEIFGAAFRGVKHSSRYTRRGIVNLHNADNLLTFYAFSGEIAMCTLFLLDMSIVLAICIFLQCWWPRLHVEKSEIIYQKQVLFQIQY